MKKSSSVNLLMASTHFFPTHGGAQLRFFRSIPGLRDRGVNTRVLAGTAKLKKIKRVAPADCEEFCEEDPIHNRLEPISDISIHRVDLPKHSSWGRSICFNRAILKFCKKCDRPPDIIQLISSLQLPSLIWLNRLRRMHIALVYAYTLAAKKHTNVLSRMFYRQSRRYLYNQMDCIIVNSTSMLEDILGTGTHTRIEYIPNGVDTFRFRPAANTEERDQFRSVLGVGPSDMVILTVGAVHPRKGTHVLLESWNHIAKSFPNMHLFIVGLRKDISYPDLVDFRYRLKSLVDQSGARDRIHFVGLVRNVEDYFRIADIFAFPSEREGMPNVVLEAMATALPVMLTPFIGMSEDLGKNQSEYILCERNAEDLGKTLRLLAENSELRIRLGENARRWVEKNLNLDQSLDRYALLYRDLATLKDKHLADIEYNRRNTC